MEQACEANVDRVARTMAASAGIDWDSLNDHPGYARNYWRERARAVSATVRSEQAALIDADVGPAASRLRQLLDRRAFDRCGPLAAGDIRLVLDALGWA
ncbi:hypothetical protein ACFB49_47170 [Sphingomonas sp. DBB INV C78]|uniref:hypothetical protein n=1 Tax=Sphingomonas sp. DBB INV C78 TaxID=3349434 RepID=UPI0036D34D07